MAARGGWRESAESLLVTILLAVFLTGFVVQPFKIPTPSMVPTLLVGDHLLVNKFIFGSSGAWYDRLLPYRPVRRGDVIVFKLPVLDHSDYVKRVVGVPGDRIKIVRSVVYVNGHALEEPYVVHTPANYDPFAENFPPATTDYFDGGILPQWRQEMPRYVNAKGELVVPPGEYFAMGDNRDDSWDSRYWGFVPRKAIMGRPVIIYWSLDEPEETAEDEAASPGRWARSVFHIVLHLPADTRWARIFRQVR